MNLHEECLLKYLINPLDLFYTTELLKANNINIEERNNIHNRFVNSSNVNYKTSRK